MLIDPEPPGELGAERRDARWAAIAGAGAALVLIVLVLAVLHTAREATHPRGVRVPAPPESVPTVPARSAPSPSTSYPLPSVQTSEPGVPSPASPAAPAPSPTVVESSAEPSASLTTSAPTTIFNPYVTTTPPNAGAV